MQKPSRLRKSRTSGDAEGYPRLVDDAADLGDTRDGTNAAQQALRESEDRYRELVEGSLAGTLVTRGEATLFASRRLAEIFGYLVEEFLALESIYEIVAPSDRERLRRYEESRLAGMPAPERYEFEGVRKDRTPVWVEISVGVVSWESEAAIQATIIDITDRKWAEQALAETADQYRALVEGSIEGILIRYGDKPIFVNDTFAEMFGYTTDEILALDSIDALHAPHERERLRIDQINRMRGREAPSRFEFEGVSRDGVQIWLETSARVVAWRGKLAIQSTVIDITERKRAEQELRESEQKFRNLIEGSIEGILIRRGNKLVFVNQHLAEIFGYSTDELLGLKSIDALFVPASRSLMRKFYRDRVRGDPAPERYEFEGKRKDGSRVWLEVSVRAVVWEGAPAVQATLVDRTQRRLEEEKRRDSEAKFRNLVEGSIQAVAVVDRKLRPRFVNPAAATMFGFDSAEELLSIETLYPHIAASDRKLLRQQFKRRLAGDDVPASYQFRGIRKDGTEIWLQNLVRTVDWDGEKCVQATLIDITDRKRAELAAVEARDSLQRIIDTIPAMVSVKDRERRYTLVNKYLRDRFGTSVIGKRARLSAPTTRLLKQEDEQVLETGELLPFHEAELTFKGESKTWLQTKVPLKNDAGEVDHILSVSFDITERKRVEEELRESEARYRSFIEQASDAVLIHSDGIIVLANSSAADLLAAASADELHDQSMMAFVDPSTHDLVKDRVGRILKGKTGVSPVEQIWRRVDGERVEVEVSGSYVHWHGRPAVKVIARDITERKKDRCRSADVAICRR